MREETLKKIKSALKDLRKNNLKNTDEILDSRFNRFNNTILNYDKTYLNILKESGISRTTFQKYVNVMYLTIKVEADIQKVMEIANYFLRKESSSVYDTPYSDMGEFCYENGRAYEYKDVVLIGDIKE